MNKRLMFSAVLVMALLSANAQKRAFYHRGFVQGEGPIFGEPFA